MRKTGAGLAMAVCLLLLTACGGGGGDDADAPTPSPAAATVPDLAGLPAAQVVPALTAAGLNLGPTTYGSSDQPVDAVISQTPASGSAMAPGSVVAVVLSDGSLIPAPEPAVVTTEPAPEPEPEVAPEPEPEPEAPEPEPEPDTVFYANCSEVRAAGADPIRRGDPGYSEKLDRDGDGIACE
jgi:hypothetical protein